MEKGNISESGQPSIVSSGNINIPVPFPCGICKLNVGDQDKALQCNNCNLWIHTKCAGISDVEYSRFQLSTDEWLCCNCQEDCGMCGYAVSSKDSAIECDKCKLWIHTKCASVSDSAYTVIKLYLVLPKV